jgi:hypothetical protein
MPQTATSPAATYAPGTVLALTVKKVPTSQGGRDTVARLMRQDLTNIKSLRRSQQAREHKNRFYIRGNRLWGSRAVCAKVVRVAEGESWTMTFSPQIGPDLAAVSQFLHIKSN